jgi:hypothetical protein
MTVAERFSRNLVAARKRASLTQEDIAFRAALHRTEIGLLERAVRRHGSTRSRSWPVPSAWSRPCFSTASSGSPATTSPAGS